MPVFNYVEIYPATGFPNRMMDEAHERDAFLRSSRAVVELYSEKLSSLRVEGLKSMLRIFVVAKAGDHPRRVEIKVHEDKPYDQPGEFGFVRIPTTFLDLNVRQRAQLVLDVVDLAVTQLAQTRGWDPGQFEACSRHVTESEFEYRWSSPWELSPGRRHEARAAFRLPPDDGWGRVTLEVRPRGEDRAIASPEAVAFCTSKGFQRSAKALRWTGVDHVSLVPYWGLGTIAKSGHLAATAQDDTWAFDLLDDKTVRQPTGLAEATHTDHDHGFELALY